MKSPPRRLMADDLPPELTAQLRKRARPLKETLAAMPAEFDLDDILIAHWRATGRVMSRAAATSAVGALCNRGRLRRIGRGAYAKRTGEPG